MAGLTGLLGTFLMLIVNSPGSISLVDFAPWPVSGQWQIDS